jgi:hypothetical protein
MRCTAKCQVYASKIWKTRTEMSATYRMGIQVSNGVRVRTLLPLLALLLPLLPLLLPLLPLLLLLLPFLLPLLPFLLPMLLLLLSFATVAAGTTVAACSRQYVML